MVTAVVQYSTMDLAFLTSNLRQLCRACDEIIVTMCDKLFSGEPENPDRIEATRRVVNIFPKVRLIKYPWEGPKDNPAYYHTLGRAIGTLNAKHDRILLVDADEIISDEFPQFLEDNPDPSKAYWFTCYWYFRDPRLQATKLESAGLLIAKKDCVWDLEARLERQQLFQKVWDEGRLTHGDLNPFFGRSGQPLMHHFSWVRSKEQMLAKVRNWGHKGDKDWVSLVEQEFSRPFTGTDFVHGYSYRTVANQFNI